MCVAVSVPQRKPIGTNGKLLFLVSIKVPFDSYFDKISDVLD